MNTLCSADCLCEAGFAPGHVTSAYGVNTGVTWLGAGEQL